MTSVFARVVAHVLLSALAFVVFYLGLGVGLAFTPRRNPAVTRTGLLVIAGPCMPSSIVRR